MRPPNGPSHRVGRRAALVALLLSAMWGANIVAIKVAVSSVPPIWSAFWRMLAGLPVIYSWARAEGVRLRPASGEWFSLAALGLLFTAQIAALNLGVNYTSAAYAVVLLNSAPIFTNVISHFVVPGDQISRSRAAGLAIAFSGVCLVFLGDPDSEWAARPLLGNFISVASGALVGVRMVYTQRLIQDIHPTRAIFWQVLESIPAFGLLAWWLEPPLVAPLGWAPAAAILYQGIVVAGIGFILWVRLLRDHVPGVLSVFAFPTPIFGVIFSALLFSETIEPKLIIGVLAVAAGILIVTREPRREAPEPASGAKDSIEDAA